MKLVTKKETYEEVDIEGLKRIVDALSGEAGFTLESFTVKGHTTDGAPVEVSGEKPAAPQVDNVDIQPFSSSFN